MRRASWSMAAVSRSNTVTSSSLPPMSSAARSRESRLSRTSVEIGRSSASGWIDVACMVPPSRLSRTVNLTPDTECAVGGASTSLIEGTADLPARPQVASQRGRS